MTHSDEDTAIRQSIIDHCLGMNASGLNHGTAGNISVRRDDHMLITPSATPYEDLTPDMIAAMPLEKKSNLQVRSLKQILALTGGVTSRIFALVKDLSIDAIISGDECVTDDAIAKWTPVWSRHANAQRRLEKSGA